MNNGSIAAGTSGEQVYIRVWVLIIDGWMRNGVNGRNADHVLGTFFSSYGTESLNTKFLNIACKCEQHKVTFG